MSGDGDRFVTSARAECVGFEIGPGMILAIWTGSEFVFGLRWTQGYFGVCLGPFALGYMWRNEDD